MKFCFSTNIKVCIRDINYGNHLGHDSAVSLLHEARVAFLNSIGLSEVDNDGIGIIVSNLTVEYKNEAFYGDDLTIKVAFSRDSPLSFSLSYVMLNANTDKELLTATTKQIFYDYTNKKIARRPCKKIIDAFEKLITS